MEERTEGSPMGEMSKEQRWIQIRNRKGKDPKHFLGSKKQQGIALAPRWGDMQEEEEVRQNNLTVTVRLQNLTMIRSF